MPGCSGGEYVQPKDWLDRHLPVPTQVISNEEYLPTLRRRARSASFRRPRPHSSSDAHGRQKRTDLSSESRQPGSLQCVKNPDIQDFSDGGFPVHSNLVFFNNALYLAPDG